MKIFIAGATGVLGRRLVRRFVGRGDHVVGISRGLENETLIRSLGGEPRTADPFDVDSLSSAAEGADVVVHAATKIPEKTRATLADWAENDRIRREGIRALLEASARVRARLYVQQSIVWLARPPDGSAFDEQSEHRDPHPSFASMMDGEALVRQASARHELPAAILRFGTFYCADAGIIRQMGERLLRRRLPVIGKGRALWSVIHVDDAASAIVTAVDRGRAGMWHVVDNEPVTVATFLGTMAKDLGAPSPRRVPAWLARLAVGPLLVSFFTDSTKTSSARFQRETGWAPKYPSFREGIAEVVAAWRAEGFPTG